MGCSCSIDDYDGEYGFWKETFPKAAKQYKCCECGCVIDVKEVHQLLKNCYDGNWSSFRSCKICAQIRDDFFYGAGEIGNLRSCLRECHELEL